MKKVLILYLPAIHQGYINFIKEIDADVYIIGEEILKDVIEEYDHYSRDLRALDPEVVTQMLRSFFPSRFIGIFNRKTSRILKEKAVSVVLPEEDISRFIAKEFLAGLKIEYSDKHFLRWHKKITERENETSPDEEITFDRLNVLYMNEARDESKKSSDWWRQVGSVLIASDGSKVYGFNIHMPTPYEPDVKGDVRSNFNPGENLDLCTAIHSEQFVIANSAKLGISTLGAKLYVTTLPCPVCARNIAIAGIEEVYYETGYSKMDAFEILKSGGVRLIKVIK